MFSFAEIESLIYSIATSIHAMDVAVEEYNQSLIKCRSLAEEAKYILDKAESI